MLRRFLAKTDHFWLLLVVTLLALVALAFFTLRGVFSALKTAKEIDEKLSLPETRIKEETLDKAYEAVFNKEILPLDLSK